MVFREHRRVFLFYLLVQAIIWAKTYFFFQAFGFGAVSGHSRQFFPPSIRLADFAFHQTMHLLILVAAFSFARQLKEINDKRLFAVVLAAAVLHNVAYWATGVFENALGIVLDFGVDAVTMYSIIITSNYLSKKHAFFRNFRIPVIG